MLWDGGKISFKYWYETNKKDRDKCTIEELEYRIKVSSRLALVLFILGVTFFMINSILFIFYNQTYVTFWGYSVIYMMLFVAFWIDTMNLRLFVYLKGNLHENK